MIKKLKIGLFLFLCILVGNKIASAKEVNIYFYPNGGKVQTSGFEESYYGYLSYQGNYYAEYKGDSTIKHINSIKGKTFKVTKSGTTLVSGREWYVKSYYNDQIYFLSESKTYSIDDIFKAIEEDGSFSTLDLYAHWSNDQKSGTDIKGTGTTTSSPSPSPTTTTTTLSITPSSKSIKKGESVTLKATFKPEKNKQTITWTSSDKNIATVNSNGKVTGVKKGTVTITGKTSNGSKDTVKITVTESSQASKKYVHIIYNVNGGSLSSSHGDKISLNGKTVLCNGSSTCTKIENNGSLTGNGLCDINNSNYINLSREGYYVSTAVAWNTKADGSGKNYDQSKVYKASDFCDASKKDCKITLYANWKKKNNSTYKIALIGNSKTRYGNSNYPNSKVSDCFQNILNKMGKKADVTVIVKGGSTLLYKAQHTPYKTDISNGTFDYVVLQEKTATAEDDLTTFLSGAQETYNLLKKKDANILVRTSWPKKDAEFDVNVDKMTSNATAVANALNGRLINDARAFQAAKNAGFKTHISDNNHPTAEGAYISAACIYKYIYNEPATKITYYHGLDKTSAKQLLSIVDTYC